MKYRQGHTRYAKHDFQPASNGFTLIELLIVVAIIAILAVIAVPNFLEAQVRAKVSRVLSDHRTIATALEAYAVDHNKYPPNDGQYNIVPFELTTPVAFISTGYLVDPFAKYEKGKFGFDELGKYYTYTQIVTFDEFQAILSSGSPKKPPVEAIDSPMFNPNARKKYGPWRLVSNGPDRKYEDPGYVFGSDPLDPNGVFMGSDVPYDATNGSKSKGNILRTQKGSMEK